MNQRSRNIIHQFMLLISQHELSCRVNQQLSSILRYTWLATKKYLTVIVLQYSLNSSFRLFTSYIYIIGRNPSLRAANFWHFLKTNCTLILTKHNSLNHFLGSQYSGFWYQKKNMDVLVRLLNHLLHLLFSFFLLQMACFTGAVS